MIDPDDLLYEDLRTVQQIPIVQTMLEVICQSTGMGFAAVARVTDKRWLACCVRDEVNFGLKAGEELPLETTLCHEVRTQGEAIVIDHVAEDEQFCGHHTPKLYGLQSYISYPIIRKNGELFGTLCAIDARPAELKTPRIINMFVLFADLLSFHLHSLEVLARNRMALNETNRKLSSSMEEVRQYEHISSHTLKEPLRKIMLFSDRLLHTSDEEVGPSAKVYVQKISKFAGELGQKIDNVKELASLTVANEKFSWVDLAEVMKGVGERLRRTIQQPYQLVVDPLPVIYAVSDHMSRLFFNLLDNSIRFAKPQTTPAIHVSASQLSEHEVTILVADKGVGIEAFRLANIFNLFEHSGPSSKAFGSGAGLAICRRIVHEHGGQIDASSDPNTGTVFRITLPVKRHASDSVATSLSSPPKFN